MSDELTKVENDLDRSDVTEVAVAPVEEIKLETSEKIEEVKKETVELETREAVFPIEFREEDETESRTMTMSVSSESPVGRDFGNEILSHRDGDIDLSRLLNKAPLLKDHDMRQQIGVIEDAYLDSQRGKLMTKVRFGRGTMASEELLNVVDGIKTQVSIGYQINPESIERSEDGLDARVTDWLPYEVSLVSSGADQSVGFGRALSVSQTKSIIQETKMEDKVTEKDVNNEINVNEQIRVKADELAKIRDREIGEILELGSRHNKSELARESIRDGNDLASFRGLLLNEIGNAPLETQDIGLNQKETRQFSILKVARALSNPTNAKLQEEASFEFEASRSYGEKIGKASKGVLVPDEITRAWNHEKRGLTTSNSSAIVFDDLRYSSLIESLRPFSTVLSANPTILTGLNGNVSIPKINPGSTSAFVTEGTAVSQSDPTLESVTLSQKTGGAYVDISRTLMMNTGDSFSVENMVRNDLSRSLATMFDAGSVSGSGAGGNPTGIENVTGVNTSSFTSAGAPSYAEIIAMQGLIESDNVSLDGDTSFYITTPAMNSTLKTTAKNGAGSSFAQEDGFIDGYPVLVSSQVTSNTIILGKFSDFIVGVYGGMEITVDPYSLSTTGTQRIVALASIDFAVRHPVSFCVSV